MTIKAMFILWLVMPSGVESKLGEYDNPHSCAGSAAKERHAQVQVHQKTGKDFGLKFICKAKT